MINRGKIIENQISYSTKWQNKTAMIFLALSIILMPFNDLPYFTGIFRELANEGAFYPLLIGTIIWGGSCLMGKKILIPTHSSAKILYIFLGWIFVSGCINVPSIFSSSFKGRAGAEKYLSQILLLLILLSITFFVFDYYRRSFDLLRQIRKFILISFIIAGTFSILELLSMFGFDNARMFLRFMNTFIHDPTILSSISYGGRIRSVSGEPSWFAMYYAYAFPWLLSFFFTERSNLFLYLLLVSYSLLLIILTLSRVAYVITLIQFVVFLFSIMCSKNSTNKKRGIFLISFFLFTSISTVVLFGETYFSNKSFTQVFTSLTDNENLSNIARVGSQYTALRIGLDSPVFGIGLAQYGFNMVKYVPQWALASEEIQEWTNSLEGTAWPPVHGLYIRIFAELGSVGLAIWIAIWIFFFRSCYLKYKQNLKTENYQDIFGLTLMVSTLGVLFCGFNTDSFRFFGYWITLAAGWIYLQIPASIYSSAKA